MESTPAPSTPESPMPALPPGVELRPVHIPASLDVPEAADFLRMVEIRNAVYRELDGNDDTAISAEELLPRFFNDPHTLFLIWLVVADGELAGRAYVRLPLEEASRVAFVWVELLERFWSRGIGTSAHALLLSQARRHGRDVLQTSLTHRDVPGEQLAAPTGFGTVPRDHHARFALSHGYTLEQIERTSTLSLNEQTSARLADLRVEAQQASSGYRVVQWMLPTPPEFVAGYGWMKSRMITDAPSAGITYDDEVWDAERVAEHDATYVDAGRTMQVTTAQHIATGELVAFNELVIGRDLTSVTHQEDTLVLAAHRGHRLGMLVKCAGLLSWRDVAPLSPHVLTYNAEENRPMLDINEAMGFEPVAYNSMWRRDLAR